MSSKITTPYPLFNDVDGRPLDAGYIYIGEAGKNPEIYPTPVFWDENLTVPAEQPVRTRNGYFAKNGRAGKLYVADADCSITAKNKNKIVVHTDLFADLFFGQKDVVKTVETINDLKYLVPWDGRTVYVKGYYKATNFALAQPYKGGGTRIYVASRKTENDNFLCINGWVLQVVNNTVTPEQAGAKAGDKAFDSSVAIQKTLGKGFITQLCGVYYTQRPVYYSSDDNIQGISEDASTGIIKVSNDTLSFGNKTINNVAMNFDVDVVLIAIPDKNWYVNHAHMSDFFLKYDDNLAKKGTTLYAPLIAMSSFTNMRIGNGDVGIKTVDAWMIKWDRVQSSADTPWWLGAEDTNWSANGTSNTFISCWAQNAKNYTWRINSLRYSTFVSCGTDHTGLDGAPADSVFRITNSDITFDGMGSEVIHAYCYLHAENSLLTFKNIAVQAFYNKYKVQNPQWFSAAACFRILAKSSVTLDGGHFDGWRTSIDSDFAAAFAFVEGDSLFTTSKSLKHFSSLEEVKATDGIFSFSKYGIYKDTAGSIDVNFNGVQYRLGSSFSKIETSESLLSKSLEIRDKNLNDARKLGCAVLSNGSNTNATTALNYPVGGKAHMLQQISAKDDTTQPNCVQLDCAFDSDGNGATGNPRVFARAGAWQSSFSSWIEFYTTANTTVDSNGFVKKASPIVQLYADKIELNDEAKEQDIVFEKLGVGDYLIKGSLGFAQESWYIEMPKNANGNVLVAVVYEQLSNKDISVKTYAKKLDTETGDVVPNLSKPNDIPGGRWIDIRLNELPKTDDEVEPLG
ncbi:pyocin knob domain-containing protein [Acinetobacter ursingii]|uniref:pyocin knob domain-containing protein n=1 Tax=Acinetobacter ursingii TaxID=108980 RepID=UPI001250C29E|nr:pyocin knob domain-containing protein [Acinetobacter ursingii]